MFSSIDRFLNSITMYRLVLNGLLILASLAIVLSFTDELPYGGWQMLASLILLCFVCFFSNLALGKLFKAPLNTESSAISALILFFIFTPIRQTNDIWILVLAGLTAMASKYIININRKHLVNPAAFAGLVLGLSGLGEVSWWVGSSVLLPAVAIFGLLVVRKLRRFSLLFAFLIAATGSILFTGLRAGAQAFELLAEIFRSWPIVFFSTVMLTEPLTTPPTKKLQTTYGVLVGLLFGLPFQIGFVYSTPELALAIGNIFSYLVSSKKRLVLKLKEKKEIGAGLFDFVFASDQKLAFEAGQYLEWTLPVNKPDDRGNRRYFTIASSPTEQTFRIGVKIPPQPSKFKQALALMQAGDDIAAGQLSGDFTLPKKSGQKLAGIAGGIGITPFRSMAKYAIDKNEKIDLALFYTSLRPEEFAYKEIFSQAEAFGLKTAYVITDPKNTPVGWPGPIGFLSEQILKDFLPDFAQRKFYLSGPNAMVDSYKKLLKKMGVKSQNIVTDYFPGY